MKNENWKMIGILIYDWLASAFWRLAWSRWRIGNEDEATRMWIKAQTLKADWCANHVYHGSGWHGLNCTVDGKQAVVQVTLSNVPHHLPRTDGATDAREAESASGVTAGRG
jgi:hypothetical protein